MCIRQLHCVAQDAENQGGIQMNCCGDRVIKERSFYKFPSAPIDSLGPPAEITAQQLPTPVEGAVRST